MTGAPGSLVTTRGDIQPIAWDLATVSGALSEIATTWRRARAGRPDLPPGLPQRLADTALRLAAGARLFTGNGQGEARGMPASLARQVSVLRHDVAAARAMTHGPGDPGVGDAALWESLGPALSS
jgi:hypothetical protein